MNQGPFELLNNRKIPTAKAFKNKLELLKRSELTTRGALILDFSFRDLGSARAVPY